MTHPGDNSRNRPKGFATRAIHLDYEPRTAKGALTPPIYMTSTYTFDTAEEGAEIFRGERDGYVYGRTKNPTQDLLERRIADLEGGEAGLAFASGMGAISALLWTVLKAGDHVVLDKIVYGNSFALITRGLAKFGVEANLADFTEPASVSAALKPRTRLVYFETPANPNLRVIDIAAITAIARAAGVLSVVDNTFATPVLQRPISLGADIVVHSATKYLGGHGDLLAGLLVGPAAILRDVRGQGLRFLTGATLSPLNAFLVLRGLKTLELRIERHTRVAASVAAFLASHPSVETTYYPFLPTSPGNAIAVRQMSGGGGLVSFELRGGLKAGIAFMNALNLIQRAVSLGDAESLVQHPASMTHAIYGPEERARQGISDGLVRLSIGLETPEDILDDIAQALDSVETSTA